MRIDFKDRKLKNLCENESAAKTTLGQDSAKKLRSRLSDLEAAASVAELAAGRPHPLAGKREGEFALDLAGGCRLVFAPDHDPQPMRDDGRVDWSRVTCVRIVYIGDYHD